MHKGVSLVPARPDSPLTVGTLLTDTRLDPSLVSQLRKEIESADQLDILCSFIKWGGVRVLEDELRTFTARTDVELRVIEIVLQTFLNNVEKDNQPAVWVIGFYGSGKSHLVKVLRYLWTNEALPKGRPPREIADLAQNVAEPMPAMRHTVCRRSP